MLPTPKSQDPRLAKALAPLLNSAEVRARLEKGVTAQLPDEEWEVITGRLTALARLLWRVAQRETTTGNPMSRSAPVSGLGAADCPSSPRVRQSNAAEDP